MSEDERTALVMKVGAIVTCEGTRSQFNSCLVLTQLPTASMVGGFHQWQDKGRRVRGRARADDLDSDRTGREGRGRAPVAEGDTGARRRSAPGSSWARCST